MFLCRKYEKQHLTQARGLHVFFTSGEEEATASTFSSIFTNNRVIVVLDFLTRRRLTVCTLAVDDCAIEWLLQVVADVSDVLRIRVNAFAAIRMPLYIIGVDCGVDAGSFGADALDKKRKRATALTAKRNGRRVNACAFVLSVNACAFVVILSVNACAFVVDVLVVEESILLLHWNPLSGIDGTIQRYRWTLI